MKISVIGTGYVGLVTGTCFAEMGNTVTCVDIDSKKITRLQDGIVPIYEPRLEKLVKENIEKKSLHFTTSIQEALAHSDICFIAVGTPMGEDGSADLKYVLQVASEIGTHMVHDMYVVDKSTVPVGTAEKVAAEIHKQLDIRKENFYFSVISNPEFLKEGAAINDFMRPDRVVIGANDQQSFDVMKELYEPFVHNHNRIVTMDVKSAEMTKYTANAMLATKISFMNEIANICEMVGADVNAVRNGIGSDERIGYHFIYPGCGYGGSCFPKDVRALIKTAADNNYDTKILKSVEDVNDKQKFVLSQKVIQRFGEDLSGMTFAVWGLSFKPETDDMREATSITVINELTQRGAIIKAYDPKAVHEAKECYLKGNSRVEYVESKYTALTNADGLILITEWKEFRSPDFIEIQSQLKTPVIFDGRNQYNKEKLTQSGFEYFQIGSK